MKNEGVQHALKLLSYYRARSIVSTNPKLNYDYLMS
jgi:hypothetical protein